jgi:hypothetical protein
VAGGLEGPDKFPGQPLIRINVSVADENPAHVLMGSATAGYCDQP